MAKANDTQLAAQLYTLRDYTKTPADIAHTLAKLSKMGWRAVQASALGPIEPKALKALLDDNGMVCVATHRSLDALRDDAQAVIDEHRTLGCSYTAVGGYNPKGDDFNRASWEQFIRDYNDAAKKFAGSGVSLGYHNHSHEYAKVGPAFGDPTAMQMMLDGLDPSIWFEIDTYWVTHGGGDPAAWVEKCARRIPCIHLKDMGVRPDRTQYMMEVGAGNLNWPRILDACRKAGVEWYIVEQDTCYRDPFDSLQTSLENLRAMGMR